jgi:hypothetical protein
MLGVAGFVSALSAAIARQKRSNLNENPRSGQLSPEFFGHPMSPEVAA